MSIEILKIKSKLIVLLIAIFSMLIIPTFSQASINGKVTSIQGNIIELDLGSDAGLRIGDTGRVYYTITISGEVKSIYVAKFKVTHISDKSCMARIEDKTGEVRVGFFAEIIEREDRMGGITIVTEPRSASVYIDGKLVGESPYEDKNLTAGTYKVRVIKEGYEVSEKDMIVESGKQTEISVTLKEIKGELEVRSEPPESKVYIDGKEIGETPLTIPGMRSGRYLVRVLKEGYEPYEGRVEVVKDEKKTIRVSLKQMPGQLEIRTDPPGAGVQINGKAVGISPYEAKNMAPGSYRVSVVREGYLIWERDITVKGGKRIEVLARLKLSPSRISGGYDFTLAIKKDGTLWSCGMNKSGQLGDGTAVDKGSLVQVGKDNNWVYVAAGNRHVVALKKDGTLWAWGCSDSGQLGDGAIANRLFPVQIGKDNDWQAISAGESHSVALKKDGTLWVWGGNYYRQLGDGTTGNKNTPIQIGRDNDWVSIAAGQFHTVALKKDGTLWSWGFNKWGQVGDGTTIDKTFPVQIGRSMDWIAVSVGGRHSVALKKDGSLWSWGSNDSGQLGDGTTTDRPSPVQVGWSRNWVSIAAGGWHTTALKSDGTLWVWGNNRRGQIGIGSTEDKTSPVQIGRDNDWVLATAGGWHTIGLKKNGTLWTWGRNKEGQLGDGAMADRAYPTQVGKGSDWIAGLDYPEKEIRQSTQARLSTF